MAFRNEYTSDTRKITVDPERGVTLRCKPDAPDGIYVFDLDWHGHGLSFIAENETARRYQNEDGLWRFDLAWTVHSVRIPEGFPENEKAVLSMITEALDAFGEFHDRDRIGAVAVRFMPIVSGSKGTA